MQTVIGYVIDGYRAALHEEELLAVDTVTHCREDVNGGVLDGEILAGFDAVLHVTGDVERTFLRELRMTLDIETSFLLAACCIHKRVGRAVQWFHFDTFAVLDMYSCTRING